jgi:hypothetical protein
MIWFAHSRRRAQLPQRSRPSLETLEDRTAPAVVVTPIIAPSATPVPTTAAVATPTTQSLAFSNTIAGGLGNDTGTLTTSAAVNTPNLGAIAAATLAVNPSTLEPTTGQNLPLPATTVSSESPIFLGLALSPGLTGLGALTPQFGLEPISPAPGVAAFSLVTFMAPQVQAPRAVTTFAPGGSGTENAAASSDTSPGADGVELPAGAANPDGAATAPQQGAGQIRPGSPRQGAEQIPGESNKSVGDKDAGNKDLGPQRQTPATPSPAPFGRSSERAQPKQQQVPKEKPTALPAEKDGTNPKKLREEQSPAAPGSGGVFRPGPLIGGAAVLGFATQSTPLRHRTRRQRDW